MSKIRLWVYVDMTGLDLEAVVGRGGPYIERAILMDDISIFWVISTIYQYQYIAHPKNLSNISIVNTVSVLPIWKLSGSGNIG